MRKQTLNKTGLVHRHWSISIGLSPTTQSQKRREIKDQSDTDSSVNSELEEVQIMPSGFKRLVQQDLAKRSKVQDDVIKV